MQKLIWLEDIFSEDNNKFVISACKRKGWKWSYLLGGLEESKKNRGQACGNQDGYFSASFT